MKQSTVRKHALLLALLSSLPCLAFSVSAAASPGDLNGDAQLTVSDAILLARLIAEDQTLRLTTDGLDSADCDLNGTIDPEDLTYLVRKLAGLIPEEPAVISPYAFSLAEIPPSSGNAFVTLNGNIPFFRLTDYPSESFEYYSPLDDLGRCGECVACIGTDLMPTEKRGEIGSVKPTGWHLVRYDGIVEGNYLYNRCHLIGYQLTAENANRSNLITGTRYLNTVGMLPFENETAQYIRATSNHVLYRVTPIFDGNDLVAKGVLMEAESIEDNGAGLCFNVFCYNIQPHVTIDYATGESCLTDEPGTTDPDDPPNVCDFVVNLNTKKFHRPECSSAADIKDNNKLEFSGIREELIEQGFSPCKLCNP